jgi:alcohol dehydrogenase (NADP+)
LSVNNIRRTDQARKGKQLTMNVLGYAASSAKAALAPYRFVRRDTRADDVVIEILYCGVCHSDLHHVYNDWGGSTYPSVPGHGMIGSMASVGLDVTRFKPGDYLGVGCMVDSCKQRLEQYCEEGPTLTYDDTDLHYHMPTFIGYSERIIASEKIRTVDS